MSSDIRNCEVCGVKSDVFVKSSALGPFSFAYCKDCLQKGLEPYGALLASVAVVGNFPEDFKPEFREFVYYNLKEHRRFVQDFIDDVEEIQEEIQKAFE